MKADSYIVTYARTLLEVAEEKGKLDEVREDVDALLQISDEDQRQRLQLFLESPRIAEPDKLKLLEKVWKNVVTDVLYNFYRLVVENRRAAGARDIFELFCELHDEKRGLVNVHVTTAVPLSDELNSTLRESLEKKLDKTVSLDCDVDEKILGGMVVRFSGMVMDGSLKSAVESIGAGMSSLKLGSELVHED